MPPQKRQFKKGTPNNILRVIQPFNAFMRYEAAGGIILLTCVVLALLISNSLMGSIFLSFWEIDIGVTVGSFSLTKPLIFWINDLLMALFFFLIGLEIKREVIIGELCQPRVALAPIIAAIGGILIPSVLYLTLNPPGSPGSNAWAIPMATDIAIALGLLSILGSKVPSSLKIFLTTLAIIDDIAGVLVIAIFYTSQLYLVPLIIGFLILVLIIALNRIGVRKILFYAVFGMMVWLAFLISGVHPTVAGILIALTIPATTKIDYSEFISISSRLVNKIDQLASGGVESIDQREIQESSETLRIACRDVETPLQLAEHALAKWAAFIIIPIFALANSGIVLSDLPIEAVLDPIAIGIIMGLTVGKPVGILLFSWVSIKLGIIELPEGVNWETMIGVAFLAGIGFTISTFIASLALSGIVLAGAKAAILLASFVSGAAGMLILRKALKKLEIRKFPYSPKELGSPNIILCEATS